MDFYKAGPELLYSVLSKGFSRWQAKGLLRAGDPEVQAIQFIGIVLGNFNAKSLLIVSYRISEKEIKEWVSQAVTIFLEGASPR